MSYTSVVALFAFLSMIGAAFLGLLIKTRQAAQHRDTSTVVGLMARLFVMMASVTLAFMIASAKNTLETDSRDYRALATDIILLDRTVRGLVPEAEDVRRYLIEYIHTAVRQTYIQENPQAETLLVAAGNSLKAIQVSDAQKVALWNGPVRRAGQVVRERWVAVDAAGGTIPTPLIITLILWLVVIFASFGYEALRSTVILGLFVVPALLISFALYLTRLRLRPSRRVYHRLVIAYFIGLRSTHSSATSSASFPSPQQTLWMRWLRSPVHDELW
jgi:hypothetical protein